ncbi:MAG: hypothetical protein ACI8R4_000568, partial [Paracoccaceae bacterium]
QKIYVLCAQAAPQIDPIRASGHNHQLCRLNM